MQRRAKIQAQVRLTVKPCPSLMLAHPREWQASPPSVTCVASMSRAWVKGVPSSLILATSVWGYSLRVCAFPQVASDCPVLLGPVSAVVSGGSPFPSISGDKCPLSSAPWRREIEIRCVQVLD